MRNYENFYEAYHETQRELFEMGTIIHPESYQDQVVKDNDDFITKELQGYAYCLNPGSHSSIIEDFKEVSGLSEDYVIQEVLDRVSSDWRNPGNSWKLRKEVWEKFMHEGKFAYTYNERWREQLGWVTEQLKKNPNTRQAVLTMYDRHQDMAHMGGVARIPCSMHYQFLIRTRNKKMYLDIIYVMRSCDFYTHFPVDVAVTMKLQEYIANTLDILPGMFTHFMGSLHAYKKDYKDKGVF